MTFSFLILENEQSFDQSIEDFITLMNIEHTVLIARTIDEALEKAKYTNIDIFLIDINLNEERTGLDFIREIRKSYPLSPVIVISLPGKINDKIVAFSELKILGYIDKPFENKQVIDDLSTSIEIAKILNNRKVTFKRQNFARIYRTNDIYCIQRMPHGRKKIMVTAYDEITGNISTNVFSIKSSLTEVLELFQNSQDIIRCHQSFLVNPNFIRGLDVNKEELILVNNIKIPIGETYKNNVAPFI